MLGDKITQIALTDNDTAARLKVDVGRVALNAPSKPNYSIDLGLVDDHYRLIDEWGIGWQMPRDSGQYYDLYLHPLANAETGKDLESISWPDPLDSARFIGMQATAQKIVDEDMKFIIIERMSSGMWEHAMWMMGYERFFTAMVNNKKMVHAIMSKILEIKLAYWDKAYSMVGDYPAVISEADNLGGQNGLLVSLKINKELIWPYHKHLFEHIKRKAKGEVFIFFYNDGAIYEAIPLLTEAGIDILNPWQVSCKGMDDTAKFKRESGKDLTIWGGSCDTQKILPFGTPQEVRDETRRRIDGLAPGGGFIFAPIHVIQGQVQPENIMAWWEILQEFGKYEEKG
jgi:uroporphyrinogen decarboxylase